jgi:regulator of nucleoside diphosphate kinase
MGPLILSKLDQVRIMDRIKKALLEHKLTASEAESLLKEINSATIVEPKDIPNDVVTMNSVVRIKFLNSGKEIKFQIVYPEEADIKNNKISILSPVATALIGYRINDTIEWIIPSGMTKILIEEIIYQPEAAGHYHL